MPEAPAQSNATTAEEWPEVEAFPDGMHQGGLLGEEYVAGGKRAPLSNAERQARFVARRSDLGDLPPPGDPDRRARCSADVVAFVETYCASLMEHPPSEGLRLYLREIQSAIDGAGQVHVRMARGSGKTTLVKGALAWALATGRLHFVVVICAAAPLTTSILDDIWNIFETCEAFVEDWPEISVPILAADGLSQRWLAQSYHGRRTRIKRTASEIRLPAIDGSASSGAVVVARGAGAKIRGLLRGKYRPDFVLLDDIQSREECENVNAIRKLEEWVQGDVQGLAGSRSLNAVMTSTPIAVGDLSDRFADPDRHPEWLLVEHPLVEAEPASPLWEKYDALWREAKLAGRDFSDATAFYAAHREEMDAGAAVLDPLKFDERVELSGYQRARNLRLKMGRAAFNAEYQLATKTSEDAVKITPEIVASRLNGFAPLVVPPGMLHVAVFVDVNGDPGLSYSAVAAGRTAAAVVKYGRYPERGRLVPKNATDAQRDAILSAALSHVLEEILSLRFLVSDTGETERAIAVWIDAGYVPDVVFRVARIWRNKTGVYIYGCRGQGNQRFRTDSRNVVQRAIPDANFRNDGQNVWFVQNADVWKERTQLALLAAPGSPGSLSLYGSDRSRHLAFASEICEESLVEKVQRARGAPDIYLWTIKPTRQNHFLDSTSGALCMVAWYHLLDNAEIFDAVGEAASETAARLRLRRVAPAGPRPDADPDTPTAPLVTRHSSLVTYPTPPPRRAPLVRVRSARMA